MGPMSLSGEYIQVRPAWPGGAPRFRPVAWGESPELPAPKGGLSGHAAGLGTEPPGHWSHPRSFPGTRCDGVLLLRISGPRSSRRGPGSARPTSVRGAPRPGHATDVPRPVSKDGSSDLASNRQGVCRGATPPDRSGATSSQPQDLPTLQGSHGWHGWHGWHGNPAVVSCQTIPLSHIYAIDIYMS